MSTLLVNENEHKTRQHGTQLSVKHSLPVLFSYCSSFSGIFECIKGYMSVVRLTKRSNLNWLQKQERVKRSNSSYYIRMYCFSFIQRNIPLHIRNTALLQESKSGLDQLKFPITQSQKEQQFHLKTKENRWWERSKEQHKQVENFLLFLSVMMIT